MKRRLLASFGLALPILVGCRADESLQAPDLSNNSGLFQRYVSMGNSITAGFQSGGINDSTQLESYAVLVAEQAKAPFFVPLLNRPGCPAPFLINSTVPPSRVGGGGPTNCALRNVAPLPYVSNVAVPGVTSFGIEDNTSAFAGTNALTQLILGGRTQVRAMMDAQPTFVSVWVGNNDVLASLTDDVDPGNPTLVTPEGAFEANYGPILDSIEKVGAKAILIGVTDVTSLPFASSGATYFCLKTGACPGVPLAPFPATFTVLANCAPAPFAKGDSILVPWTKGVPKITAAALGATTTLDCSADGDVVLPNEYATLRHAVAGYNAFIASEAHKRKWAYLDVNPPLLASRVDPAKIAPFPTLPTGPTQPDVLFGSLFSLDGVHPSGAAHRIVADSIIAVVNRTYGTTIPLVGP